MALRVGARLGPYDIISVLGAGGFGEVYALTHPHICTLYGVGHDAGTDYLVMEYLEGETLAARLSRGPLTLNDA